ncbi:hypothetical protein BBP40_010828 [Aspergillus hancockii]|nr:hypothetical protein BBP40_010828 [Aspergillus hancockii]
MPPIGGVDNGALLFRGTPIGTISSEAFEMVTKAKVKGIINLDRTISDNRILDWSITSPFIVGTTGNMGQAAYSAANGFMKALINNRRSRGLAGSVIDISRVFDGLCRKENQDEKT